MQVSVGPRLEPQTAEWYRTHFTTLNGGVTSVAEAFPVLYRRALAELRGRLTREEARLVLASSLGLHPVDELRGQCLPLAVRNHVQMSGAAEHEHVDAEKLMATLGSMTSFQAAALEIWAAAFWGAPDVNAAGHLEYALALVCGAADGTPRATADATTTAVTCPNCGVEPAAPDGGEGAECVALCSYCWQNPTAGVAEGWEGDPDARRFCQACEETATLSALERAADRMAP